MGFYPCVTSYHPATRARVTRNHEVGCRHLAPAARRRQRQRTRSTTTHTDACNGHRGDGSGSCGAQRAGHEAQRGRGAAALGHGLVGEAGQGQGRRPQRQPWRRRSGRRWAMGKNARPGCCPTCLWPAAGSRSTTRGKMGTRKFVRVSEVRRSANNFLPSSVRSGVLRRPVPSGGCCGKAARRCDYKGPGPMCLAHGAKCNRHARLISELPSYHTKPHTHGPCRGPCTSTSTLVCRHGREISTRLLVVVVRFGSGGLLGSGL